MYFQGPTLARFQTPAMKNALVQLTDKKQDRKKKKVTPCSVLPVPSMTASCLMTRAFRN